MRARSIAWSVFPFVLMAGLALSDHLIGSPDMSVSRVDEAGRLCEDWGIVGFELEEPEGATRPAVTGEMAPMPRVTASVSAGPVTLSTCLYRSPIWPNGADVCLITLQNAGTAQTQTRLRVTLPKEVSLGEMMGVLGGRLVLALPDEPTALRQEREWGCTGGVTPMPGWARPKRECDPAFRNISAGMGGVPIIYRFRVPAGESRTVVLGLCESYCSGPGIRPLVLDVEGAAKMDVDPIALWGQHGPGCLHFDARDENADGKIQIASRPGPGAQDRNPILNVIWVFPAHAALDMEEVLSGRRSSSAERYVDVGGGQDQLLYESGDLAYDISLGPGMTRAMTFLVASPGASVPDPIRTGWTAERLEKAARTVWDGALRTGVRLPEPLSTTLRRAAVGILMTRTQSDDFYVALPGPVPLDRYSHEASSQLVAALDYAGLHQGAERLLRFLWDVPVPGPLAWLSQTQDGQWKDNSGDERAHGFALQSLARHGLITGDVGWIKDVFPSVEAASRWIEATGSSSSPEGKASSAIGLLGAARMASVLGRSDLAQTWEDLAKGMDPGALWMWKSSAGIEGPVASSAVEAVQLRQNLASERGRELWLLASLDPQWLYAGEITAGDMPTEWGAMSLKALKTDKTVEVTVNLDHLREDEVDTIVIAAPILPGMRAVQAELDRVGMTLDAEGKVHFQASPGTHAVRFVYR